MAKHIVAKGVVQGVGFRPFVYGLATRLNLHGWVCSTSDGVEIVIDGQKASVEEFIKSLTIEKPPLAILHSIRVSEISGGAQTTFEIRETVDHEKLAHPPIAVDLAICPECQRELFNPTNRRYLYPFINCSHCGPRFSLTKDIPYDRHTTTMAAFRMCDRCQTETLDPLNRRFHAPMIACPDCGPFVELRETHSQFPTSFPRISSIEIRVSAILKARRLLREGYIVAIKGSGGFHLACDASNPYTLAELRDRKCRNDKPFAVMAADIAAVASICQLGKEEHLLLAGKERPVVLLSKKKQTGSLIYRVSELVAPNLDTLGVMLPYTALHHLLLNQTDPVLGREPVPPILVMTSGTLCEEPIATENKDALERLSPLADAFLLHNRDIHVRSDDSVVKVGQGNVVYLRRSRGYAPYLIRLPCDVTPTLALGGERKNTFCLTRGHDAFLSHHIGDMENAETHAEFEQGIHHLSHILGVQPEVVAHDLHPGCFTSRFAEHWDIQRVAVQHHHAHIASCMADNGLDDKRVIGLSFDGTGHGTDGGIWGGEVLLASYAGFERFSHLEYLPLPGGDSASRFPWRIAIAYTHALGIRVDQLPFAQNIDKQAIRSLRQQVDRKLNSPLTSSVGSLFDAVASLIGIRNEITYPAQAAIEMEVLSKPFLATAKAYPYVIEKTESGMVICLKEFLSAVVRDLRAGEFIGFIAARFHRTVAEIAIESCCRARESTDISAVALSGDVWENQTLLDLVRDALRQRDFTVYFHKQAPTNDGGLALGQAVVANYALAQRGELVPGSSQNGL
jgi:hydrogenase maturation protein HypF